MSVEALLAEIAILQEALYRSGEAYDSLELVHAEVCVECNELSEENANLKQEQSDSAVELEACLAELDICLDALTETGLLPQTEADELKKDLH